MILGIGVDDNRIWRRGTWIYSSQSARATGCPSEKGYCCTRATSRARRARRKSRPGTPGASPIKVCSQRSQESLFCKNLDCLDAFANKKETLIDQSQQGHLPRANHLRLLQCARPERWEDRAIPSWQLPSAHRRSRQMLAHSPAHTDSGCALAQ